MMRKLIPFLVASFFFNIISFSQSKRRVSIDHLKFEKQWILKNLADEYFLKASSFEKSNSREKTLLLETAFAYYQQAKAIQYNNTIFKTSGYYFEEYLGDLQLANLVKADINFRLALLEGGEDFWGISSHNIEDSPQSALKRFNEQLNKFRKTAQKYIQLDDADDTTVIDRLDSEIDEWKDYSNYNQYIEEKRILEERFEQNERLAEMYSANIESSLSIISSKSELMKQKIGELEKAEKSLLSNIEKGAYAALGIPNLKEGFNLENSLSLLSNSSTINEVLKNNAIVNSFIAQNPGMYELAEEFRVLRSYYDKGKKIVKIGERIDDLIEKDNFELNDLLEIGSNVVEGMEVSGFEASSIEHLKKQLDYLRKLDRIKSIVEDPKEWIKCVKTKDLKCADRFISQSMKSICGSQDTCEILGEWNEMKNQFNELFGDHIKLGEQIDDVFDSFDLTKGAELLEVISKKTDFEIDDDFKAILDTLKVIKDFRKIDDYYKLGDAIFNNVDELKQYEGEWIEFAKESKPLAILIKKYENDLLPNKELIIEILKHLDFFQKINAEQNAKMIFQEFLYSNGKTQKKLEEKFFYFLIENKPDIISSRIDNSIYNKDYSKYSGIHNESELKQYLKKKWEISPKGVLRIDLDKNIKFKIFKIKRGKLKNKFWLFDSGISVKELAQILLITSPDEERLFTDFLIQNFDFFQKNKEKFVKEYFQGLTEEIEKILKSNKKNHLALKENVYPLLYNQLSQKYQNELIKYTARVSAGTYSYFKNPLFAIYDHNDITKTNQNDSIPRNIHNDFKTNVNELEINNDDYDSKLAFFEGAIFTGLNYYFPGAGHALNAVKVMGEIDGILNEYNSLLNDVRSEERVVLENYEKREKSKNLVNITKAEAQLMDIRIEMHEYGMKQRGFKKVKQSEIIKKKRDAINKLLPRLFYNSELLRREYAALNRAFAFWHGKSVYEQLITDKYNIRLAIDQDIKLYQWLNLNNVSKRTDVRNLINDWEYVSTFIGGLTPDKKQIGSDGLTAILQIKNPLEELNWIKDSITSQVYAQIDLKELSREHDNFERMKRKVLLTYIIMRRNDNQILSIGSAIKLKNDGVIDFPKDEEEFEHNLSFKKAPKIIDVSKLTTECEDGLNSCLNQFKEERLKKINENPFGIDDFYSYPLDAKWYLIIDTSAIKIKDIKKIELAFLYQYSQSPTRTEIDFVALDYNALINNLDVSSTELKNKINSIILTRKELSNRIDLYHLRSSLTKNEKRKVKTSYQKEKAIIFDKRENLFYSNTKNQ